MTEVHTEYRVEYRVAWEWFYGAPGFEEAADEADAERLVRLFATADPNGRRNTRIQTRTVTQWTDR
jgi:hypothetical protein